MKHTQPVPAGSARDESNGFSDGDVIVMKQTVPLDKVDNRIVMEEVPEFELKPRSTPNPVTQSDAETDEPTQGIQQEVQSTNPFDAKHEEDTNTETVNNVKSSD